MLKKKELYKLITFKFFEFSMKDDVKIMDQVHEFMIMISKFKNPDTEIPKKVGLEGGGDISLPNYQDL